MNRVKSVDIISSPQGGLVLKDDPPADIGVPGEWTRGDDVVPRRINREGSVEIVSMVRECRPAT
jgi:hypothetical protein